MLVCISTVLLHSVNYIIYVARTISDTRLIVKSRYFQHGRSLFIRFIHEASLIETLDHTGSQYFFYKRKTNFLAVL